MSDIMSDTNISPTIEIIGVVHDWAEHQGDQPIKVSVEANKLDSPHSCQSYYGYLPENHPMIPRYVEFHDKSKIVYTFINLKKFNECLRKSFGRSGWAICESEKERFMREPRNWLFVLNMPKPGNYQSIRFPGFEETIYNNIWTAWNSNCRHWKVPIVVMLDPVYLLENPDCDIQRIRRDLYHAIEFIVFNRYPDARGLYSEFDIEHDGSIHIPDPRAPFILFCLQQIPVIGLQTNVLQRVMRFFVFDDVWMGSEGKRKLVLLNPARDRINSNRTSKDGAVESRNFDYGKLVIATKIIKENIAIKEIYKLIHEYYYSSRILSGPSLYYAAHNPDSWQELLRTIELSRSGRPRREKLPPTSCCLVQ
jgi:hypothetical protein